MFSCVSFKLHCWQFPLPFDASSRNSVVISLLSRMLVTCFILCGNWGPMGKEGTFRSALLRCANRWRDRGYSFLNVRSGIWVADVRMNVYELLRTKYTYFTECITNKHVAWWMLLPSSLHQTWDCLFEHNPNSDYYVSRFFMFCL